MDGLNRTMSSSPAGTASSEAAIVAFQGITVTKYLAGKIIPFEFKRKQLIIIQSLAAGLVVLLYDHLLLFGEEVYILSLFIFLVVNEIPGCVYLGCQIELAEDALPFQPIHGPYLPSDIGVW